MTANLAKTSTNANGSITIGHYILGNYFCIASDPILFRQGPRQGHFWTREAGNPRAHRREGNPLPHICLMLTLLFYFRSPSKYSKKRK